MSDPLPYIDSTLGATAGSGSPRGQLSVDAIRESILEHLIYTLHGIDRH